MCAVLLLFCRGSCTEVAGWVFSCRPLSSVYARALPGARLTRQPVARVPYARPLPRFRFLRRSRSVSCVTPFVRATACTVTCPTSMECRSATLALLGSSCARSHTRSPRRVGVSSPVALPRHISPTYRAGALAAAVLSRGADMDIWCVLIFFKPTIGMR